MTDCSCDHCKSCCERVPGWFTPEEAAKAIDAGYASRLSAVLENSVLDTGVTIAIAPSIVGNEGMETMHRQGRCTFLTEDGRCEIHDSGFKPIECRTGFGCRDNPEGYPSIKKMHRVWKTKAGIAAVDKWKAATR